MLGRLPSKLRYGSSGLARPNASASDCAIRLATQQVVVLLERVVRLGESDEVDRHDPGALVEQLVERVLAVRAGFAPHDRSGVVAHPRPVEGHGLAVRFHVELLEIRREAGELLGVRQHRLRRVSQHVAVPDADQTEERRRVRLERRAEEVFVDHAHAGEELPEVVRADGDHQRQPDRRADRVPPADPVPELEHVRRVDAELRHPSPRSSRPRRSGRAPRPRRARRPATPARSGRS